jgi:hypothetical protein
MFQATGSSRHGHTGPDAWEPPPRVSVMGAPVSDPAEVVLQQRHEVSRGSGEGRTRTGDTPVFSRVLYQLSYLAAGGAQSSQTVREQP